MTDPADYEMRTPPTWRQDLGALRAVADWAAARPPSQFGDAESIASATGVNQQLMLESLERLDKATPAVLETTTSGETVLVYDLTERGRQIVGLWPSPEQVIDQLIAALSQAAENEPDEAKQSKLKAGAIALATAARDIGVAAVGQTLGGMM